MYQTISTKNMSREEWLRLRKTGLGGSDAGAVCGLNPYTSPMGVYKDKTSEEISDTDKESMRQGRDLEDYVAQRFMEATGFKVRRSHKMYRSKEFPFMLADVDRMIDGQNAGLECKTCSAFQADKWKDGQIPAHYMLQCFHYMAVTGKREWYIAVVILGQDFQYRRIQWDDGIIQQLIAMEAEFWNGHVLSKIIPEPDGSQVSTEVLEQYFHTARKNSQIPLVGFDEKLQRREMLVRLMAEMETERKKIEQEIQLFMQDHELAVNDKYRVSWANVETSRLDTKRIKAERPEIYQEFLKTGSSRRFTIKAA
ncbi:MAG: YqaJ viral recombinase family protein [Lachnospiraceae bacterium]|nr:YqaJ viral recombinase family protein [Lachnospiraceae bacterium]